MSSAYRKRETCSQHRAALTWRHDRQQASTSSDPSDADSQDPSSPACSSSRRSPPPSAPSCWRRRRPRRLRHPSTSFVASTVVRLARPTEPSFAASIVVRVERLTVPSPTARRSSMTRPRVWPTLIQLSSVPCARLQPMPQTTGSSSSSIAAGVPRTTRNNYSTTRSRSTARKRKLPDGWPPPTRLLTCPGTRSTLAPRMPQLGCPSTAPSSGYARSTATNPGTTNCAPKPSTTVARRCTPTRRTIQGCSSHRADRGRRLFSWPPTPPLTNPMPRPVLLDGEVAVTHVSSGNR